MSTGSPLRPKMLRGGLVQMAQTPPEVISVVAFQYNPDTVTRTLTPRAIGGEPGDRLEVLRLTGPPKETIKLEAEFDYEDEHPEFVFAPHGNTVTQSVGLMPTIAALEAMITPTITQLTNIDTLFQAGQIEIAPIESPLTLLVWGPKRIVPVLLTSLTFTEEAFGPQLQPIRAKVSFELKTLTTNDFPSGSPEEQRYLAYRQYSEQWAAQVTTTDTHPLGIERMS